MAEKDIRKEMQNAQSEKLKNVAKAQEIVLNHLENAIQQGDSATVAAMAEILSL